MKKFILLGLFLLKTSPVVACSVCYGAPDALMTKGLNMGILSMLLILVGVLGSFIVFFVQFQRRTKMFN